ncbi:MAG: nitrite/sulfite reductase, partial [Chloroflexi bacterium]|nr:nitrite/sulfite reductase [Chloroflexota bacterium]
LNPIRGGSIGCTGNPQCNFAVGPTKPMLVEIVEHLEQQFGERVSNLHVHVDGCPHACGQHHVGDLGFQGTTLSTDTGKEPGYDIYLKGALGPGAAIGKPLLRRVRAAEARFYAERLVRAYLDECEGLPIQQFFARHTDAELISMAQGS